MGRIVMEIFPHANLLGKVVLVLEERELLGDEEVGDRQFDDFVFEHIWDNKLNVS